jgi:NADH-quinone oxidoreductase subunit D
MSPLRTEEMVINMGPQHPSTHGVIRLILTTDGEVVSKAVPDVGYLHRGIEKIAEKLPYAQFMPFTDRIDYLASINCNHAWAHAVEKLSGIEVPKRAQYIRVITDEMVRIISHLIAIGSFPLDIGAVTPFVYTLREREYVNDILEMLCGARLTYNFSRIGGVSFDLPDGFFHKLREFLDRFEGRLVEYDNLISFNKIFIERLANLAVISKEHAISYGLVGPNLRASGVKFDLRKNHPYAIYPELDFEIPVGDGRFGVVGDCYDRYYLRINEIRESIKILRQCMDKIPSGEIIAKVPRIIKPPQGELYTAIEAPRGELGFYIISDGTEKPSRVRIRTGSFTAMSIIESISNGLMIADMVALMGSLDVIAPEIDR